MNPNAYGRPGVPNGSRPEAAAPPAPEDAAPPTLPELVDEIRRELLPHLDNQQLEIVRDVLTRRLAAIGRPVRPEETRKDNEGLLRSFVAAKRMEGRSARTLAYYEATVDALMKGVQKHFTKMTTEDIREYLESYYGDGRISKVTFNNVRRNLSSFFGWLEEESVLLKSPMRRIHKMREPKIVKTVYGDETMIKLREACRSVRDLAIIDLLSSSGVRIGELVKLDRTDLDFANKECVVLGKGDKERRVWFDAQAKVHLERYLAEREDDNPALFVEKQRPHDRLEISGVEVMLRTLGRAIGEDKVHPHKFRRTVATKAIDKGMPIEQVQHMLGHESINTTLGYALVKEDNVKNSHKRILG